MKKRKRKEDIKLKMGEMKKITMVFNGCPIHKGEINVEEKCLPCPYYSGDTGDFFFILKWCKHPDIVKKRAELEIKYKKVHLS